MTEELEWIGRAACRGLDPDLFFPKKGESAEPAKATCATCPGDVVEACFAYSVRFGIHEGVWGGQSERQRRKVRVRFGLRSDPAIPKGDLAVFGPSESPASVRTRKYRAAQRAAP
jgi:WhiB family redox-sensing transcriptional regulator